MSLRSTRKRVATVGRLAGAFLPRQLRADAVPPGLGCVRRQSDRGRTAQGSLAGRGKGADTGSNRKHNYLDCNTYLEKGGGHGRTARGSLVRLSPCRYNGFFAEQGTAKGGGLSQELAKA